MSTANAVQDVQLFIDGQFRPAADGQLRDVIDPATGAVVCRQAWGTVGDVDDAVESAARAFVSPQWSGLTLKQRARLLLRIADAIEEDGAELARLESIDVGKPIIFTQGFDVPQAAEGFRYYAGMVEQIEGAMRQAGTRSFGYTRREPLGVVAAITPFNFPLNLAVNKIAPALAAGNTFVLKPAEQTPLSSLYLADIMSRAGLPAGVFNVVTGDGPTVGARLARHPRVIKLAFTGSTATGKKLIAEAAGTLKKVTAELGGKGANIVFADADLDAVTQWAFQAAFFNTGQFCMSGSRLLVHRSVHDELVSRLTKVIEATSVGDPLDPATMMGPLAHRAQLDRVTGYVALAQAEGATLRAGGNPVDRPGFFHEPTLFTEVTPDMRIAQEEVFGPVLTVTVFDTDEEAVAIANGTPYGLAAGLHTASLTRAHRVAAQLAAGIVWVNTWAMFENSIPFGGYKDSGYGRELGPEGLQEYQQLKSVVVNVE
ncbi:aldehyde dehydrogenase family protein [Micromonospora sp. WMMD714]|uniref:aldehyde dehydrogenase family protein n=1 Tax=Micromonospora sp. WMMD714 TaxID=3016097 RepID=UPI00249A8250|nr:aldehyde dehydrogenase family protein [Micromonospora sp. WMMD714]WFE62839.1 aldehyde dehydrogenase family protein [Micromonospora sp. WMMD714]